VLVLEHTVCFLLVVQRLTLQELAKVGCWCFCCCLAGLHVQATLYTSSGNRLQAAGVAQVNSLRVDMCMPCRE
jgi:hypothetical protein